MFIFHSPRVRASLNLTPLIDVVFILLLFFMLVSRKPAGEVQWRSMDLATTQSINNSVEQGRHLVSIEVRSNSGIIMQGHELNPSELIDELQRLQMRTPDLGVRMLAGTGVNVQQMISVTDQVRVAGISHITFSARHESD